MNVTARPDIGHVVENVICDFCHFMTDKSNPLKRIVAKNGLGKLKFQNFGMKVCSLSGRIGAAALSLFELFSKTSQIPDGERGVSEYLPESFENYLKRSWGCCPKRSSMLVGNLDAANLSSSVSFGLVSRKWQPTWYV